MNSGKAWEAQLDVLHQRYRAHRLGVIHKTHPPTKLINRRLVYVAKGPPDFIGNALGRPVAFDAKDCQNSRWQFSGLKRHQALDLEANQVNGGVSFIALRLAGEPWVVPWTWLGPRWWGDGKRSLVAADLDEGWRMGWFGWIGWLM